MRVFNLLIFLLVLSCSTVRTNRQLEKVVAEAEDQASEQGRKILSTGRSMIEEREIIRGSCWDYVNAVYSKAGFSAAQRMTPMKSKFKGPYAEGESIEPGDWLYFINHSFKEIDHSGIFVGWTNADKREGVILSYVGGKMRAPGNYRIYDLSHVYYIMRAKAQKQTSLD